MTSYSDNQPSDNGSGPVLTPAKEQIDAKTVTVGVKRGEFPDGAATVMVLDHFQHTWQQYGGDRVPQECNLLFVRDTQTARLAMYENPAISVVIVQGMSRKVNNPLIDKIRGKNEYDVPVLFTVLEELERQGEPVHEWLDDYDHTLDFLRFLREQGFGGLVQVVSHSLQSWQRKEMRELEGLRVQYMSKQTFFSQTFIDKMDKLWEQIARFERFEQRTGRVLTSSSPASRHLDRLLEQVVYPHPAEDRLFERWSSRWVQCNAHYAQAVEEVLTWLEELKLTIKSGDIRRIYEHASHLPESREVCKCRELDTDLVPDYRWVRYYHLLHNNFNRAVWEILDMAGLMEWMQLELELDMASQSPDRPEFGRQVRRSYGRKLRGFFQPEGPSERWVERF